MDIMKLVEKAVAERASDIHLMENCPPYFRIDEDLMPVDEPAVSHEDMLGILAGILPKGLRPELLEKRGVDIGHQFGDLARCRIIVFFERRHVKVVFRLIPMNIPSLERLELASLLGRFALLERGMLLVTGSSGAGKSTTLAALLDRINETRKISINTIENPIEYVFRNKQAIVSQREIGDDVRDFSNGAIQSMRQDPDVIMIGEMRDLETARVSIQAAETGHLLLSTLHTMGAVQTVARIVGFFPEMEQDQVRDRVAASLAVVITQQLVKRISGTGRIAALEIMVVTEHIAKLIQEGKILQIYEVIKGGGEGMQTLDQGLANLVREKKIKEIDGAQHAVDIHAYHRCVKGVESSSDRGWMSATVENRL
jgi:twitching motility protein PilT